MNKEPYLPETFGAWCIGFIVTLLIVAFIARDRHPRVLHIKAPGFLIGAAILLLIPVLIATVTRSNPNTFDPFSGVFYGALGVLSVILAVIALVFSNVVTGLRLAVLPPAAFAGAFTQSAAWDYKIYDNASIFAVALAWTAVIAVVAVLTILIPKTPSYRTGVNP